MSEEDGRNSVRATDRAKYWYETAEGALNRVLASAWQPEADVADLLRAQSWAARNQYRGDKDLATGLRATYILLKRIDERLQRLERSQHR